MKNTILKFDKMNVGDYEVHDYTSKKVDIFTLSEIKEIENSTYVIEIDNNDTLEKISHRIYGTTDYWDILAVLNDIHPLFGLSFYDEVPELIANKRYSKYAENFDNDQGFKDKILQKLQKEEITKNEKRRYLKVIDPESIHSIVTILRKGKYM